MPWQALSLISGPTRCRSSAAALVYEKVIATSHSKANSNAERRLLEKSAAELIPIAQRILEEVDSYELSEALAKIEETGQVIVSELTRRRIMAIFDKRPYSTEFEGIDFIRRVWPTNQMPSIFENYSTQRTLEDDLFNAIVRNNDWGNRETLDAVGYLTCSQKQFFRFLEEITSPLT